MDIFNKLKNKYSVSNLKSAVEKIEKSSTKKSNPDYWSYRMDETGAANAIIRFLPPAEIDGDDASPAVKFISYNWKNKETGKTYYNDSPRTINMPDPIYEYNNYLYKQGVGEMHGIKQRVQYISNILVINDYNNPENNGKVFLWKYPKAIYDKILKAAELGSDDDAPTNPFADEEKEEPFNPFSPIDGADFKLHIYKKSGNAQYDKCKFGKPHPIGENEEEIIEILSKTKSLKAEIAPDKFKSYDELKRNLDYVLGAKNDSKKEYKKDEGDVQVKSEGDEVYENKVKSLFEEKVSDAAPKPTETNNQDNGMSSYFSKDELDAFDVDAFRNKLR